MKSLLLIILCILTSFRVNALNDNTYESLGIDSFQKQEIEENISAVSKLPVINISTKNNSELILSKEEYTDCVVDVFNVEDHQKIKEKSAKIKVRGNSTSYYGNSEKIINSYVPYKIKFTKKTNMLGLNNGEEFKNWVLLKSANNHNSTNLYNYFPLKIGHTIFGDKYYVSDATLVNLYINDELKGVYTLCEQNQIHEKRVNLSVPEKYYNGTDIGYYMEIDNYYLEGDNFYFCMDYENALVKDIRGQEKPFREVCYVLKNDIYSQEQVDFISNYTRNVFKIIYYAIEKNEFKTLDENYALVNSTYTNAEETIGAVVDIESFVDMYLLYEIVHDYDIGEGSFFFAVDFSTKNGEENSVKLQLTSPWDFNWTFYDSPERYWAGTFSDPAFANKYDDRGNPWFILLAKEEWFRNLVSIKWNEVSETIKMKLDETEILLENCKEDLNKIDMNIVVQSYLNIYESNNLTIQWLRDRFQWMDEVYIVDSIINNDDEEDSIIEISEGIDILDEQDDSDEE